MLVLQPMPIRTHSFGLGQVMSPGAARRSVETVQADLAMMLLLVGPRLILNLSSSPLSPGEISGLEADGFIVQNFDSATASSFNDAVDVLIDTAALITGVTRGQAEQRGLRPSIFSGVEATEVMQSAKKLLGYWRESQGEKKFPWMTVIGIVGLVAAVGGGVYVIRRQTR